MNRWTGVTLTSGSSLSLAEKRIFNVSSVRTAHGGVYPGDRHDLRRERSLGGNGLCVRGGLPGQRGAVVDLLRPDRGLAREVITSSENPGLTVLSAYTYSHVAMIAGIIALAAADELIVAHPGVQGTLASVALTLGGTGVFVAGQALFKWAVSRLLPWSRVGRARRVDRLGTSRFRDASARAQRRSGLG